MKTALVNSDFLQKKFDAMFEDYIIRILHITDDCTHQVVQKVNINKGFMLLISCLIVFLKP